MVVGLAVNPSGQVVPLGSSGGNVGYLPGGSVLLQGLDPTGKIIPLSVDASGNLGGSSGGEGPIYTGNKQITGNLTVGGNIYFPDGTSASIGFASGPNLQFTPSDVLLTGYGGTNLRLQYIGLSFENDTFVTRNGPNTLQLGRLPNAAPAVNMLIIGECSRGGGDTNLAGANGIISSGSGTGTGAVSSLIFQTPTVGVSGTGAQVLTTRLTITGQTMNTAVHIVPVSGNSYLTGDVGSGHEWLQVGTRTLALGENSGSMAFLTYDGPSIIAQRNGTVPQKFRLYSTYTDASNYECLEIATTIGVGCTLSPKRAGTGSVNTRLTISLGSNGTDGDNQQIIGLNNAISFKVGGNDNCFVLTADAVTKGWVGLPFVITTTTQAGVTDRLGEPIIIKVAGGSGAGAAGYFSVWTAPSLVSGQTGHTAVERWRIDGTGQLLAQSNLNLFIGTSALAVGATSGFLGVNSCPGTPTGAPTVPTGQIPMVYDSTANKIWFRSGGTWRGVVVA